MADFDRLESVIDAIRTGIKDSIHECFEEKRDIITMCVTEQLYSGIDGEGEYLKPTYDDDPYFNEKGPWHGANYAYKKYKERITPPVRSYMLNLPPRPLAVPNLFIIGTFHASINAARVGDVVKVYTSGFRDGPEIERKYGEAIFKLTDDAREYFNIYALRPWLNDFMINCGYR
ncbi:MAG: hypothetical protein IJR69_06680 [Bacteroidaceae bacterium]|nr:hypothetical protein [Bacteroidaceae bacterium]